MPFTPEDDSDDSVAREQEERSQKRRKQAKFDAQLKKYNLPGSSRGRSSSKSDRSGNKENKSDRSGNKENQRTSNPSRKNLKMTKTRKEKEAEAAEARRAKRKADQQRRGTQKEQDDLDRENGEEFIPDDDDSSTTSMSPPPPKKKKTTKGVARTAKGGGNRPGRPRNDLSEEKRDPDDEETVTEDDVSFADPAQNNDDHIPAVSSPEPENQGEAQLNDQEAQPPVNKDMLIASLQQQLAVASASDHAYKNPSGRKVKKKEMTLEERLWISRVKRAVHDSIWHINKFCNGPKRLQSITRTVMRFMKLDEFKDSEGKDLKGDRLLKKETKWIVKHKALVLTSFNTIRNDAAGHIRTEYINRVGKPVKDVAELWKPDWYAEITEEQEAAIKANLGKNVEEWEQVPTIPNLRPTYALCVPTLQDIQDCIEREPRLMNTPEGRAVFDDYVDRWLYRIAGKANWDIDKRHHQTVSLAARDVDGEPCIDPGMEAMLFMFFENQHHRHAGLAIAKMGGPDFSTKKGKTSPWTCSDGGQMPYGGWTDAGQDRWKIMREKVTNARERTHVQQMEAECLARLRKKHGHDGGGRKPKAAAAAKRPYVAPAEDSDNDFLD